MKWYAKTFALIIKGILFFLLPIIILFIVIEKALIIIRKLIAPIKSHIPEDGIFGIGMVSLLSILLLLSISFIAGIWAENKKNKTIMPKLEEILSSFIPGYALIKTQTNEVFGDTNKNWKSVIVGDNGEYKLGIEIERNDNGYSTVFFPDPADTKSGELKIIQSSKIKILDLSINKLSALIRKYGLGSASFIK
ncbi:hypothetical protein FJ651_01500 [Paucihalobacter ruber]|uniref:DUF502 domain-containing protein n=1 Tax=Paucihalobacter ruber TaxID=2567861 RepID=A0A506PNZ5_9FLAO|nr:hypothetical protein [Paucihalobacter ruber]TPV35613.1 hypothetical protein FJ651_01500 [Paucihalobacter ruber]